MKNHIPLTSWACEKKTRMLSYESKFSRHMRNMDNAAEHFMFFKWKSKFGVKNKGTILFTNHFDLGWKENSLIKIDWDPVELSRKTVMISTKPRPPPPPRGLLWLIFPWYVPLASQGPYPIIVYFVANCRPHISHFWANMSLLRSQVSHFLFMYLPYQSFK